MDSAKAVKQTPADVNSASAGPGEIDRAEQIRRRFAEAWSQMGASWGIAPSTAAVQGYLLAHGGPVTDAELQQAFQRVAVRVNSSAPAAPAAAPEPTRTLTPTLPNTTSCSLGRGTGSGCRGQSTCTTSPVP